MADTTGAAGALRRRAWCLSIGDWRGRSCRYHDPMIEDRELWACANLLLRQHGEAAREVALRRAEVLRARSESEGARIFQRIADHIATLEAPRASGTTH